MSQQGLEKNSPKWDRCNLTHLTKIHERVLQAPELQDVGEELRLCFSLWKARRRAWCKEVLRKV